MSELGKAIDRIASLLHVELRARGFTKSARTFRLRGEECTQVVNMQASTSNMGVGGRFTVNLGVFFPAVAEVLPWPAPKALKEHNCQLRERLGLLLPDPRDRWWQVSLDAPVAPIAEEVREAVVTYGLPWLEARSTLEAGLDSIVHSRRYSSGLDAAAFCIALGRLEEAAIYLARARDEFIGKGKDEAADRWLAWGEEHGVVA